MCGSGRSSGESFQRCPPLRGRHVSDGGHSAPTLSVRRREPISRCASDGCQPDAGAMDDIEQFRTRPHTRPDPFDRARDALLSLRGPAFTPEWRRFPRTCGGDVERALIGPVYPGDVALGLKDGWTWGGQDGDGTWRYVQRDRPDILVDRVIGTRAGCAPRCRGGGSGNGVASAEHVPRPRRGAVPAGGSLACRPHPRTRVLGRLPRTGRSGGCEAFQCVTRRAPQGRRAARSAQVSAQAPTP